jgi:hypothetical protein
MRRDWEDKHKVTEEFVEGPPSRRANATLTPCPNGNHLWCIGGEFFSENKKAVGRFPRMMYIPELIACVLRSTSIMMSSGILQRRPVLGYLSLISQNL